MCSRSVSWGEEGLRDLRSPDAVNAALYILCMCPCRSARISSMCFMCSRRTPGGTEQPCMQSRPRHRPRSPVSTGVRSLKVHAPGTVPKQDQDSIAVEGLLLWVSDRRSLAIESWHYASVYMRADSCTAAQWPTQAERQACLLAVPLLFSFQACQIWLVSGFCA